MIAKIPLRFHPYLKTVIWGGDKICSYKGIPQPEPSIGESWEVAAVPGHESVVADGPYEGTSLTELIDIFGKSLLGENVYERYNGKFPLLIKLIDANDDLSVQVHPDDTLAMKRHGSLGKSEMWYIIRPQKGAKIYAGFNTRLTPDDYEKRVEEGTFAETLAVHDSHPGDVFYLPAGRVHAIGAGNLLAEIQESSDITYRIYDYNRRDKEGNLRELHTAQAKDAIDYTLYDEYKTLPSETEKECNTLVRCEHFTTYKISVKGDHNLLLDMDSFAVLMCVEGKATLQYPSGNREIKQGETLLLPANLDRLKIQGEAVLLLSHC